MLNLNFSNCPYGYKHVNYGADRIYKDVSKIYPGHRLPQLFFKEFVQSVHTVLKS